MKRSLKIGLACTLSSLGIALIIIIIIIATKSKQSNESKPVKSNNTYPIQWYMPVDQSTSPILKQPSVRCNNGNGNGATYRAGQEYIRHYPNPDIANQYDSSWNNAPNIDCTKFIVGTPCSMEECHISVRCDNDPNGKGATYRYFGDKYLRHYPNPDVASRWDLNWVNAISIDCTDFFKGKPCGTSECDSPIITTFYEGLVGDDTSVTTPFSLFDNNAKYKVDSEEMKQLFKDTVKLATSANISKNIVVVNMWVAYTIDDTSYRGINYRIHTAGTLEDFKNRKSFKIEDGIKTISITALIVKQIFS